MTPEPSAEQLIERVRVSFYDRVLGMTCLHCASLELVHGDPDQFDDEVRRFLRTHPGACDQLSPAPTRRLRLVPRTRARR